MNKAFKTVLTLTAMLAAGCNDGTVAPKSQPSPVAINGGGPTAALSNTDTVRFSFVIDPARTVSYTLGEGNSIVFPAGSLCDPSSSYGATEWDAPCQVATAPLTVGVKAWLDKRGQTRMDFDKAIRFVPTLNPGQFVMLTMTDYHKSINPWLRITYCPKIIGRCIDESKTDPTLTTVKDTVAGRYIRRIKHFSSYSITTGEPCTPSPDDPDCVSDGDDRGFFSVSTSSTVHATSSVKALLRDHQLPDHPTKAAWIGPMGGTLSLPQAGATLTIPAGAVSTWTWFSMTSVGGKFVAYEFEPHGRTFAVPLVLTQDLRGVRVSASDAIVGGYFADAGQLDFVHGTAVVNELINVTLDGNRSRITMPIKHFSGYMMASGRSGSDE